MFALYECGLWNARRFAAAHDIDMFRRCIQDQVASFHSLELIAPVGGTLPSLPSRGAIVQKRGREALEPSTLRGFIVAYG
jgi:hypothetical protein